MTIGFNGDINRSPVQQSHPIRPVICLNSDVLAVKNSSDIWELY